MLAVGIAFVAIGAIYLRWPMLFRRGIWLKTSIAVRLLSEKNYRIYMRVCGSLLVTVGIVLIYLGATRG